MNRHIEISITASDNDHDYLVGILSGLNPTGFEQRTDLLIAYFTEGECEMQVIADAIQPFIFKTRILEEQNWNALWEKNFEPVLVGVFCGIRADFHERLTDVKYEIIITPKMSFGTGHHDTTYMMIEKMEQLNCTNTSVFDFGTGTGVLAILACKLGAGLITASDNDEWSISNAAENIEKNGCSNIELIHSASPPVKTCDIILANINKNVILQFLPDLKIMLNRNGRLLVSGFLSEDEQEIAAAGSRLGLRVECSSRRGNWILLQFLN